MRDSSESDAGPALAGGICLFAGAAGSPGLAIVAVREDGRGASAGGMIHQSPVLIDVTQEMRIFKEESAGPVRAVYRFDTEEEALAMTRSARGSGVQHGSR